MENKHSPKGWHRVEIATLIVTTSVMLYFAAMGVSFAADERGITAIKQHLARPESFLLETESPGVDMGTYTYSAMDFTAENNAGKREAFSAVIHTSADGLKLELVEIKNKNTREFVFDAGTEGVKAEMVSVQAETWTDPDGKECTMIYLKWKNVGSQPIHEIRAEIRAKDAKGRIIEDASIASFCAYASSDGKGVQPGQTFRKPKGDGWILGEVSHLKRLGFKTADAKILQAYGKRGLSD